MATTETFVHGRPYEMPLADLQPDPNQPRKYIDPAALDELTESVKQQGEPSFATAPTPEKKPKILS
jgi:ParB family chromosome partitioning protein